MTIYVDDSRIRAKVGRIDADWFHMFAIPWDDVQLHVVAAAVGLKRSWLQRAGTYRQHYDLTAAKRQQAFAIGVVPMSAGEYGRHLRECRLKQANPSAEAAT